MRIDVTRVFLYYIEVNKKKIEKFSLKPKTKMANDIIDIPLM